MRRRFLQLLAWIALASVMLGGARAAINANRQRQYLHASQRGDLQTVRWCLSHGVSVNTSDGWSSTALRCASIDGHDQIIDELIEAGVDPNECTLLDRTALMWAAKGGHASTVALLLDRGADADVEDAESMTAFDHAKANGHTGVIALLAPQMQGMGEP